MSIRYDLKIRSSARRWKFKEKDALALVKLSAIKSAIKNSRSSVGIKVEAVVKDLKGNERKTTITLRPILVKLLRGYSEEYNYTVGKDKKIRFYKI